MNIDREIRKLQRQVSELTATVEKLLETKNLEHKNNRMTVTEFAKAVGCSKSTVLNRINRGIYAAEREGKLWYLPAPGANKGL